MRYNINSGYGAGLVSYVRSIVPTFGRIFVVLDPDDTDEENYDRVSECFQPDPAGQVRLFTSLSDAYDATESNNNDVILLDANSTHSLTSGLAITKNRVHFIGMDGGDRLIQQGAKVQLATAATTAYVIKNTGVRNSFRNIKFIMGATAATGLNVLQDGSEGSLYKNCSFVFGVVDNLDLTTASEVLCGSDSATFLNCTFGNDTLLTSAARTIFKIDQVTANQEFKSNIIKDCIWQISTSETNALFVSMAAAGDILFSNLFINPTFVASLDSAGGVAVAKAVTTANGTTKGCIALRNPVGFNVTNIGSNGTNNDQLQVYGPAFTTGTDLVGVAPVAT